MSSELKPLKLWGRYGANPPKIAYLLKELSLPYETVDIQLSEVKNPSYIAVNPNGRIPAIYDPNTDLTLWESGAIIEYLIETYDKSYKFSFPVGTPEYLHAKQWLYFQVTGQGPYYGQAAWFKRYHHEQLPSAIERYVKEVNRVTGVLEERLKKQKEEFGGKGDGPWLVGNKISYADIAFVQYQRIQPFILDKEEYEVEKYPEVKGWLEKMLAREAIKKAVEETNAPLSTKA